ncbi:MAG: prepilin-type N-terminal cleavage/methylation domain-containing protein [Planctomycetota bacterium]|nr:MAG: prepilin-type N-terminal cleavage/methylation domain-containing protein [Planctomycetota bacterium]
MLQKGFTLIELMIVVAIIAIIAAIAIPALLHARMSANEGSAIANLRTISSSQEQYRNRFGTYSSLADLSASTFIDDVLGKGQKSGYSFSITTATDYVWACVAVPIIPGNTGVRGFRVDQSGVIRFTTDSSAPTTTSPPVD